jgi:O-antigen/teichoic acid export membrane protein
MADIVRAAYRGRITAMSSIPNKVPVRTGVVAGVMLVTLATYLTYGVGIISNAIIARGLAPLDFGRYVYVIYISGILVILSNHGLTTSGIRFVAELLGAGSVEAAQRTHGYLRRLGRYSEGAVLLGFVAVALIVRPTDWRADLPLFLGVIVVSAFAKARYLFDISIAKGYSLFRIDAYSTVSVGFMTVLLVVALHLASAGLGAYLLLFATSSAGYWLIAAFQVHHAGVRMAPHVPDASVLARLQPHLRWTALLMAVGVLGNKSVEVFLLNATHGAEDVGFFAIGAALTRGGIDLLTSGLMTVLMPVMSDAYGRGGEAQVRRIFMNSFRYLTVAGLVAAGAGFCLAAPTVRLLYGPEYLRAITAFQVMVVVAGLTLGEAASGSLLSTTDRQRSRAVLVAAQILITVVCALLLVPRYGFYGAIWSHALSRMLGFALACGWVGRNYRAIPPLPELLRLLLCAGLAAAVAWAGLSVVHGMIGYAVGAVAYVLVLLAASVLARCWTSTDLALIASGLDRYAPSATLLRRWTASLGMRFGTQ